tara:strand:- start:708 stop:1289 length:582 start_codon:yes stop_codon:yes gene_type:complete
MNDNFIIRYKGAFSQQDCDEIINYIEYLEENNLLYYDKESLHRQDNKTVSINNGFGLDIPTTSRISRIILPKYKPCIDDYVQRFSVLDSSKFLVYDVKLKKVPSGGGFHSWHYENGSMISASRMFVIQLYLNDGFEGGETEFLYQNLREEAVAGDVVIFPAGYTHVHRGNPPIGGTKYTVTSWAVVQDNGGYE